MVDYTEHKNKNLGSKYTNYSSVKLPNIYDILFKYYCTASDLVPKEQSAINPNHFASLP